MKFAWIIFSLCFIAIDCDSNLLITEDTAVDTVIRAAIELSKTHRPEVTNSYVRHRHDFVISLWQEVIERIRTRSLKICTAIDTDSQSVLSFYASNQVLHNATKKLVINLTTSAAAVTDSLIAKMREKELIAIPTADFIMHDVESSHKKLRPNIKTHNKVCASDFKKFFRSLASVSNICARTFVIDAESIFFDWGFKLADVHQNFLDATETKSLTSLSNNEVLAKFQKLEEDSIADMNKIKILGLEFIQTFYNKYMICIARVLTLSRTSESAVRRRTECVY